MCLLQQTDSMVAEVLALQLVQSPVQAVHFTCMCVHSSVVTLHCSWTIRHPDSWTPGQLNTQIIRHLHNLTCGQFDTWTVRHLDN